MALDAETGIFTFDDGPEIRDLERMYGGLRREMTGNVPGVDLPAEDHGRPAAATAGRAEIS